MSESIQNRLAQSGTLARLLGADVAVPASTAPAWLVRQVRYRRVADLAAVVLGVAVALFAERVVAPSTAVDAAATDSVRLALAGVLALAWFTALRITGAPEHRSVATGGSGWRRALVATFAVFGGFAIVANLLAVDAARPHLLFSLPAGLALLLTGRGVLAHRLAARRSAGIDLTRALVVGTTADIEAVSARLARARRRDFVIAGVVVVDEKNTALPSAGDDVVFTGLDAVADAVSISNAELVLLATPPGDGGAWVQELGWRLEGSGAELAIATPLGSVAPARMSTGEIEGLGLLQIAQPRFTGLAHVLKRSLDIVVAGTALLVLAPVLGVIALLVRADSAGGALFRQTRVGRDGSTFRMIKFRSMVTTAESDRAALLAANEGSGPLFKLRRDPRITRVGAVLRKYSLDELPQLWNILLGDMSLVGPRPPLADEVAAYDRHVHRRLLLKPGLTGAWQVSGRSDLSWEESVRIDLSYVENWSVAGDLRIIARTVGVVLKPNGAY